MRITQLIIEVREVNGEFSSVAVYPARDWEVANDYMSELELAGCVTRMTRRVLDINAVQVTGV